jgi:hypothetical protein
VTHRRFGPFALLLVLALLATAGACGDDDGDDRGGALPPVDGTSVPDAYRIVYEVTTPESTGREEHVVHRPFDAHIVERDGTGTITAERWSTLGQLLTRSQGAEGVRIDTAVAPAASDVRPDLFLERLEEAGKLQPGTDGQVGGRPCHRVKEVGQVAVAPDAGTTDAEGGSLPVVVERCVDAQGLVLEERFTTAGGQRVRTKRAIELELGDDVPEVEVPDLAALPDEQGNGAVQEIDAEERPPFVEAWDLDTPEGFTFVGRYAVAPARLAQSNGALTADAGIALYTDVWERGGDLLFLDQGATESGAPPFDDRSTIGSVDLEGIGPAVLAVDLRIAEVRLVRPEGGFVRVAGTVAPDELVELAGDLELLPAAAP